MKVLNKVTKYCNIVNALDYFGLVVLNASFRSVLLAYILFDKGKQVTDSLDSYINTIHIHTNGLGLVSALLNARVTFTNIFESWKIKITSKDSSQYLPTQGYSPLCSDWLDNCFALSSYGHNGTIVLVTMMTILERQIYSATIKSQAIWLSRWIYSLK